MERARYRTESCRGDLATAGLGDRLPSNQRGKTLLLSTLHSQLVWTVVEALHLEIETCCVTSQRTDFQMAWYLSSIRYQALPLLIRLLGAQAASCRILSAGQLAHSGKNTWLVQAKSSTCLAKSLGRNCGSVMGNQFTDS